MIRYVHSSVILLLELELFADNTKIRFK